MPKNQNPIGIFDSGIGGLTVVRALQNLLPHEPLVYLGDTARVPYGSKSAETVLRYSEIATRFLLTQGVKAIVIACNTASAFALEKLQQAVPIPVIGVIEPGAQAALAASKSGNIGVIGTLGTIRSQAYPRAIAQLAQQHGHTDWRVFGQACPLLVPLAEEGWTTGPIAEAIAREYVKKLAEQSKDVDVLLLGCTHYPLLVAPLTKIAQEVFSPTIQLIDSAKATAAAVQQTLASAKLTSPQQNDIWPLRIFVTDDARIDEVGGRFLGSPLENIAHLDL